MGHFTAFIPQQDIESILFKDGLIIIICKDDKPCYSTNTLTTDAIGMYGIFEMYTG